jgi:hypothetical protein
VGQTVADFTVIDTDGNSHNLYAYTAAGKYIMLDFFFTTCGPCQATQPYFNQLHDKYGCNQGDLVCLSINTGQDNNAAVIAFEAPYGGTFQHSPAISGDGGSGAVDNTFNPAAYPTYCLIGPDNKLINADIWPINNVGSYEAAFPVGSNITPMACSVGMTEAESVEGKIIISVFPNPANTAATVNLTASTNYNNSIIEIIDVTGRVVQSHNQTTITVGANSISLDVSILLAGSYTIRLKNNDAVLTTTRFIIAR